MIDQPRFRHVLGQYPTGVSVVTGIDADGAPVGLAVGTFTSVSLDPPLVGFLPARTSTSWPKIERAGRFCINVLSDGQEDVCRVFATKGPDKFAGLRWRAAPSGAPILHGGVAWIDCDLHAVHTAGDHFVVLGRVRSLDLEERAMPLLFLRGGYGRFATGSLVSGEVDLKRELRLVDLARPEMERLARTFSTRCIAVAVVRDRLVVLATTAGGSAFIGERTPLIPNAGALFVAFGGAALQQRWLAGAAPGWRDRLAAIRARGYSVALRSRAHADYDRLLKRGEVWQTRGDPTKAARRALAALPYDPPEYALEEAHSFHAPVFAADGTVALSLNALVTSRQPRDGASLRACVGGLLDAARRVNSHVDG